MGSPLSAILANTYLCHYEKIWLNECPQTFRPIHYKRYMDDTFLCFQNQYQVPLFLNFLNNKLPNIKFTREDEHNNSLPFLDLLITKEHQHILTSIYRKNTTTKLGLNFFSHIPLIYKTNSLRTLLHRGYHLTSSYTMMHKEFNYLKDFFSFNKFNNNLISKYIHNFLSSKYESNTPIITVPKNTIYVKLPFYD